MTTPQTQEQMVAALTASISQHAKARIQAFEMLQAEVEELRRENARLRTRLAEVQS